MYPSIYADGSPPRSSPEAAPAPAPAASAPSSSPGSGATPMERDPSNPSTTPQLGQRTPDGVDGHVDGHVDGMANGGLTPNRAPVPPSSTSHSPLPGINKGLYFPPIWPQNEIWDRQNIPWLGRGGQQPGSGPLDRWRAGYDRYERRDDKFAPASGSASASGSGSATRERDGPDGFDHYDRDGYYDKTDPFNNKASPSSAPAPSPAGVNVVGYVHPHERPLPPRLSLFNTPYYPQHQVYGHAGPPPTQTQQQQPSDGDRPSPNPNPTPPSQPAFGLSNIHDNYMNHSLPTSNHLSPPNHLNHLPMNHMNHLDNLSMPNHLPPPQNMLPLPSNMNHMGMHMQPPVFPFPSAPDWPGAGPMENGLNHTSNPDLIRPREYLGSPWNSTDTDGQGGSSRTSTSGPGPSTARRGGRSGSAPPAVSTMS
jgi:hypothetical protein